MTLRLTLLTAFLGAAFGIIQHAHTAEAKSDGSRVDAPRSRETIPIDVYFGDGSGV